jgi:hypothetical protein
MAINPVISWDLNTTDSDVAGYRIYFGLEARTTPGWIQYTGFVQVLVPCKNWLRMTVLTKYVTNYLAVTAFDTSNNESGYSTEVTVIPTGGLVLK